METYTTLGGSGEFLSYPTNRIIAVFAEWGQAKAAIGDLSAGGYGPERIGVLHGQEGAKRLDASGELHGLLAQISRFFQRFADMDHKHTVRHEQELTAGHVLVSVDVGDDEAAKAAVHELLKRHDGYFINYYGKWVVENLSASAARRPPGNAELQLGSL